MRQDGDEAGMVGLLDDYGLYFLARALAVSGRSVILELERGTRTGEVHFVKGQVVAARVGRMFGVPAFQQLLLWGEASMHMRFETSTGERRINVGIDALLDDGAKFAREFERLAARIGGPQALYRQVSSKSSDVKIPAEVVNLLPFFDGKRPIIDIVEDSPFKAFDTIKITYRLSQLGVIEVRESVRVDSPLTAQLA